MIYFGIILIILDLVSCTYTHTKNQKLFLIGPRLNVPTLDQSRRSSLSESSAISGISSASSRTYIHEASTLVLETVENGIKRYKTRKSLKEVFFTSSFFFFFI